MSKLKYYTLIKLNDAGETKTQTMEVVKRFLIDTFGDISDINSDLSDASMQRQLLAIYRDNSSQSLLAECSLRCFISWQIEQVCISLEQQFGEFHGFTRRNLFPYVLDDDGKLEPSSNYICLSRQILASFDINASQLKSWINRLVKQQPELKKYLLECGLYLMTDWAILNDTQPSQLPKVLNYFANCTNLEITEYQQLLSAYHQIYRNRFYQQIATRTAKSKCYPPTEEQLRKITDLLIEKGVYNSNDNVSLNKIRYKLEYLADFLREYRINIRKKTFPTKSIDVEINEQPPLIDQIEDSRSENTVDDEYQTEAFLKEYQPLLRICLDDALKNVLSQKVQQFKNTDKANKFLLGLRLFHCEKQSMSQIAKELGLPAQYAVTRLLKLNKFRAHVSQETLVKLRMQVIELAQKYSTPTSLSELEQEITKILNELIGNIISQAESEAACMQNINQVSFFAQRLCQQLNQEL